jgi:hypothetical protein
MTSQDPKNSKAAEENAPFDRVALSALHREVQTTHLLVWTTNAGGALTSAKIPVTDIAQQISMAGRILESNLDEAIKLVQSASNQFDSISHRWDSQARQSEAKLRVDTAARRLNEAKAHHNGIRTRIVPVQGLFRRAAISLDELKKKRRRQAEDASSSDPTPEDGVGEA